MIPTCEYCMGAADACGPLKTVEWKDKGEMFRAVLCRICAADSGTLHLIACEVREAE